MLTSNSPPPPYSSAIISESGLTVPDQTLNQTQAVMNINDLPFEIRLHIFVIGCDEPDESQGADSFDEVTRFDPDSALRLFDAIRPPKNPKPIAPCSIT